MYDVAPPTNLPSSGVNPPAAGPAGTRKRCRAWMAWLLVVLVAANSLYYGLELRRWAWDVSTNIRFVNSVSNAIEWGQYANKVGVLDLYDQLLSRFGESGEYAGPARFTLDYPPLRLLIASWWADWAKKNYPPKAEGMPILWRPDYAFNRPMLRLNIACEITATVGMFLLVYRWMRMCHQRPPDRWWGWNVLKNWGRDEQGTRHLHSTVGLLSATLAALLLWFNPAVIFNAHVYPQWDVWLLPAFIFAVYFGLRNWWLGAGICVGICAMAKGQILFAFPLLIGWPLLLGNWAGALRLVIGLGMGVGMITWPWMLRSAESQRWMLFVALALLPLIAISLLPRGNWKWLAARGAIGVALVAMLYWPVRSMSADAREYVILVGMFVGAMAILGNRWWLPASASALLVGGLALTVPLYGATLAWYRIGTEYATRHWKHLFWCHAPNLGSILEVRFQWQFLDEVSVGWLPGFAENETMPIRHLMIAVYCILLFICVIAAVRHRRAHDERFLLAIATPFLLAYAFLPQMIERYLLWPAALLGAFAAINMGGLLLWLVLSVIGSVMMLEYMLALTRRTQEAKDLMPYLQPLFPDIGWAIMVLAITMLFMTCRRSRPRYLLSPGN